MLMIKGLFLLLCGAFIALLEEYLSATKTPKKRQDFRWNIFWRRNIPNVIGNMVIGIALLVSAYHYNENFYLMFMGYDITGIALIIVGLSGHYLILVLAGIGKTILRSRVGNVVDKASDLFKED